MRSCPWSWRPVAPGPTFRYLGGWRAAASYAFRSRRSSPVAERLVFMAVEGAARHLQGLSPDRRVGRDELDEKAGGLLMLVVAAWIVPPSVSLTRTGFRVWSPMTGLATFLEAATRACLMISVIWGPCAMSWRVSRPWRLLHTGGRALAT